MASLSCSATLSDTIEARDPGLEGAQLTSRAPQYAILLV